MIFVDTSAFYALADSNDSHHERAKESLYVWAEAKQELVTHNYILSETYALLHRKRGITAVKLFYRDIYQLCRILWVSQSQHERASKNYAHQESGRYSFVDCVSFEIMRSHGMKSYFGFDEDFDRAGFHPA